MRIHNLLAAPIVATAFALGGCATMIDSAPPLTIDALVQRAKLGESVESLLASLRGSRERFALSGSEYALLKERGLPAAVLDELQKRELQAVRDDQWRNSRFYWNPWGGPWSPFGNDTRYIYVPAPPIPMPKPR
ncbi:MAG: hypothetical protein ABIZ64_06450 [Casimicrobium sp.]